jgi:hypothetical protein
VPAIRSRRIEILRRKNVPEYFAVGKCAGIATAVGIRDDVFRWKSIPAGRPELPRDDLQSMVSNGRPLQVVLAYGILAALDAPSVDVAARSRFVLVGVQAIPHVDGLP